MRPFDAVVPASTIKIEVEEQRSTTGPVDVSARQTMEGAGAWDPTTAASQQADETPPVQGGELELAQALGEYNQQPTMDNDFVGYFDQMNHIDLDATSNAILPNYNGMVGAWNGYVQTPMIPETVAPANIFQEPFAFDQAFNPFAQPTPLGADLGANGLEELQPDNNNDEFLNSFIFDPNPMVDFDNGVDLNQNVEVDNNNIHQGPNGEHLPLAGLGIDWDSWDNELNNFDMFGQV